MKKILDQAITPWLICRSVICLRSPVAFWKVGTGLGMRTNSSISS